MKNAFKKIMRVAWKIYCVIYFRGMMIGHYLKGDIKFHTLWLILLPPSMRPKDFDYFGDLPHPPAKFPGTS